MKPSQRHRPNPHHFKSCSIPYRSGSLQQHSLSSCQRQVLSPRSSSLSVCWCSPLRRGVASAPIVKNPRRFPSRDSATGARGVERSWCCAIMSCTKSNQKLQDRFPVQVEVKKNRLECSGEVFTYFRGIHRREVFSHFIDDQLLK